MKKKKKDFQTTSMSNTQNEHDKQVSWLKTFLSKKCSEINVPNNMNPVSIEIKFQTKKKTIYISNMINCL